MPDITGHHHVALTVTNCAVSAAWYQQIFGMVELFSEDGTTRRARVLGFAGGGYSVGLVEHVGSNSTSFSPTQIGLDHVAFNVADRDELQRWATHFTELEIPHSGVIDIPAGSILNLTDPDGIAVALFVDRSTT